MHTLSLAVSDAPGVLNRIVSLFRRRGVNIASLTVGPTEQPAVSRMTVVAETDAAGARRMTLNLRKVVPVLTVADITARPVVARDLALIRVRAPHAQRPHVFDVARAFRATVVDVGLESVIVEVTGTAAKITRLVDVLRPFGILEMARSGRVVLPREGTMDRQELA